MAGSGSLFDEDPKFRDMSADDLIRMIDDGSQSVILRGRALLEIGRRAGERPDLRERLFDWTGDAALAAKRWAGPVTLAWIAACGLGHAVGDPSGRARLAGTLHTWPDAERESLLSWARHENWFYGID